MPSYCTKCGTMLGTGVEFCPNCGTRVALPEPEEPVVERSKPSLSCPKCGGADISIQTVQESLGEKTVSRTKSKYKEKGHGIIWWLCIGWWWWIIDLFIWIFAFFPRVLLRIARRKKYKGKSKTVSRTKQNTVYKNIFVCHDCGHSWQKVI